MGDIRISLKNILSDILVCICNDFYAHASNFEEVEGHIGKRGGLLN